MSYGLDELEKSTGMSLEEMLEESLFDGVCMGICVKCGYTTECEPDAFHNYCEDCEGQSVASACALAGVI